jgi:hypothetical protein
MKIETQFSLKEYQKLTLILTYRRPAMIIICLMGTFMVISALYLIIVAENLATSIVPQFLLGIFFLIGLPFFILYGASKNYKTHGKIQGKVVYDFTEEKISIAGESFNSEMNWNSLYKIVELKEWIILYHNRQAANFIPKTGIGENLTELRNLIQSKKDLRSKLRKD